MKKRVLYLGLRCPASSDSEEFVHYPVIRTEPAGAIDLRGLEQCTHAIVTSRTVAELVGPHCKGLVCLAVGPVTADALKEMGVMTVITAKVHTAEGICELLHRLPKSARLFYPHSDLSRPLINETLEQLGLACVNLPLYTTVNQQPGPVPDLTKFDAIVFTSPSTVRAFLAIYGKLPKDCELRPIGPVTAQALAEAGARG